MKRMLLWVVLGFCALASFAMDGPSWQQEIDDQKLKSSGSYLLVKKEQQLYVILGVRNKPQKNEDGTLSSFHGALIRQGGICDHDALMAAKRNLAWEFFMLNGDPQFFPENSADGVMRERQEKAKRFLNALEPKEMLKNSNWEKDQRPNFIFLVEYVDITEHIEQFEKNAALKAQSSKWLPEFNKLVLIEVDEFIKAIEDQIAQDPEKSIKYGQFTDCAGYKIYDACSRTVATSLDSFKRVVEAWRKEL